MYRNSMDEYLSTDVFLQNVVTGIEQQLKELNSKYFVEMVKAEDLIQVLVKDGSVSFPVIFEEWILEELKYKEPFRLEKKIWKELQLVGLQIIPPHLESHDFYLGE